jgi:hypothetical protein
MLAGLANCRSVSRSKTTTSGVSMCAGWLSSASREKKEASPDGAASFFF